MVPCLCFAVAQLTEDMVQSKGKSAASHMPFRMLHPQSYPNVLDMHVQSRP